MPSSRKPRNSSSRDIHPSLAQYRQKERGERLQKVLADAGVAARRECEKLIVEGAVTVNGKTIDTLPAWVDPTSDRIEVYGRPLRPAEKHVYIMLFKPRGTVCTNSDPEGRPRAIDLVNHPSQARLYCVGRLDIDASGMLILTNDGEFANRLTHPRYEVAKGYDVTLDGRIDATALAEIERKIFAAGRSAGGASELRSSLRLVSADSAKSMVHLELCEHRNLQLRDLMLSLGHPVKKVRRTSFGPLKLKGLAVGEWRELTGREIDMLRKASSGAKSPTPRPSAGPTRTGKPSDSSRTNRTGKPSSSSRTTWTGKTGAGGPSRERVGPRAGTGGPRPSERTGKARAGKMGAAPSRGESPTPGPAGSGSFRPSAPSAPQFSSRAGKPASSRTSSARTGKPSGKPSSRTGKPPGKPPMSSKTPPAAAWKQTRTGAPRTRKSSR
jgi:pseudouridine synthase